MLEVQDIHTYYGDSYVLQGLSLRVDKEQIVAILGRNGVGKTTLIRSITGLTPPRRGHVIFNGTDITRFPIYRIARIGVRVVPQGRRIFSSLTVRENLEIVRKQQDQDGERKNRWEIDRVFSLFPVLKERLWQRGGKLSGGEQQMLATGRALMGDPELLLMDEPSEGLAPLLVQELAQMIQQLKREGLSILLVEQSLQFALEVADYVYIMSKGTIVHESLPQQLWQNEEVKAKYLGL